MSPSNDQFLRRAISGADGSISARLLRTSLALVEPFYAAATLARNAAYHAKLLPTRSVARPTISVGNLTTGGTGKTPVVRWLASQLVTAGLHPAILLRGYRADKDGSDEQRMLDAYLNASNCDTIPIRANPSRVAAARQLLREQPAVDRFILDDAFQHRRAARDFDLVLINAANPFGYGHVLPRGLLREPLRGLARAHAILITHASEVSDPDRARLIDSLRKIAPEIPVYQSDHVHSALRSPGSVASDAPDLDLAILSNNRFFAFCGIGDPRALETQLQRYGSNFAGAHWFPDHHHYTADDLTQLAREASAAGAQYLITTEKDWVKLRQLPNLPSSPQILRLELALRFHDNDEQRLIAQVLSAMRRNVGAVADPA